MSTRITLLILSLSILTACETTGQNWGNGRNITASNNVITEDRDLQGFDEIKVCCSIAVDLHQSNSFGVEVEAPDNVLQYVRTEVVGDRLEIGMESNVNIRNNRRIRVRVSMPSLEAVGVSSSSTLEGHGTFQGGDLDIQCSSSGRMELDFEGDDIDAVVNSSGTIKLAGSADRVDVNSSSSGSFNAYDLQSRRARINSSSSSSVKISVSEDLNAKASSSASVRYRGQPNNVNTDSSSGASIRGGN
ncbi:MAG: head GIN domain-containing protein [Bacteroidota bacterium]